MKIKDFFFRLTHWETWHYLAKYIPLAPAWFWYCIRSGSFWFFTTSNPTLTFGGFEGESKREMYDQLPVGSYPFSVYLSPTLSFYEAQKEILLNNLAYPFAVKPDVGMMGLLFRKINNQEEFRKYHQQIPFEYIAQEFVDYPLEVSVFYYRYPNEVKGNITGFLRKDFLQVVGDGISTIGKLISGYPRVRFRMNEIRRKNENNLHRVLPAGETYYLSPTLNLSRGGKLVSLEDEKNDSLLDVFDGLSHYTGQFYYGRYDIKCKTIEDLKNGKNFTILEFNGCGAEPHHIYGNGYTLLQAYGIVLQHWKILYRISRMNNQSGTRYWNFRRGLHFLKKAKLHFKLLKQMDRSLSV